MLAEAQLKSETEHSKIVLTFGKCSNNSKITYVHKNSKEQLTYYYYYYANLSCNRIQKKLNLMFNLLKINSNCFCKYSLSLNWMSTTHLIRFFTLLQHHPQRHSFLKLKHFLHLFWCHACYVDPHTFTVNVAVNCVN